MLSQKETILQIIRKELNYRILEHLLYSEQNVTKIAKEINSTKARVSIALNELQKKNLVIKKIFGKSHVYTLNKLSHEFKNIARIIIENDLEKLNYKLDNLPKIADAYLKSILKESYLTAIFFGSVISEKEYRDIDVYVILHDKYNKASELSRRLLMLNAKLSVIFGTIKELREGIQNKDSLFENILNGLPSSSIEQFIELKYNQDRLKRKDIEERFMLAVRELHLGLSEKNIERAVFDLAYAALNSLNQEPKNDSEAVELFKKLRFDYNTLLKAKQGKLRQQEAYEFAMQLSKVIYN